MSEMHRGILLEAKLRILWQKINLASFGLNSRGKYNVLATSSFQDGHRYDVIPPKS